MVFECFQGEIELNGDNLQISETSSHSKDNIPKCFGKFDHFFFSVSLYRIDRIFAKY